MKNRHALTSLMFLALLSGRAMAQVNPAAAALAPYVDEFTFLAGYVDVPNVSLPAIFARADKLGVPKKNLESAQQAASAMRDGFVKAGGRRIYFVWSFGDALADGPLWIVPIDRGTDGKALAALFEQLPGIKTRQGEAELLAGSEKVLEQQKNRQAKLVPEFAKGFAGLEGSPSRIVFVAPQVLRRAQQELIPQLPKELGGEALTPIVQGVSWAGVGFDLSAKGKIRLLIQAKNEIDADRIEQLFLRIADRIKKAEKDEDALRLLGKLIALLSPKAEGTRLQVVLDHASFDSAVLPLLMRARQTSERAVAMNNLKQIGLAMHMYYDVNKSFPPQYSVDKQKKPLLSWRVHILPYIEQNALYKQFRLDEPWDSEHNKALIAKMPTTYRSPLMKADVAPGKTTYLLPSGPKLLFDAGKKSMFQQITDGTSNTIMAIDADDAKAVFWTMPEDLTVDPKQPKQGAVRPGIGILTVFCDGSARVIRSTVSDEMLWNLFCPNDGNPVKIDDD